MFEYQSFSTSHILHESIQRRWESLEDVSVVYCMSSRRTSMSIKVMCEKQMSVIFFFSSSLRQPLNARDCFDWYGSDLIFFSIVFFSCDTCRRLKRSKNRFNAWRQNYERRLLLRHKNEYTLFLVRAREKSLLRFSVHEENF